MSVKTVITSFASFLGKYATESAMTARALAAIADTVALTPKQRADIDATINRLESIALSVANAPVPTVTISKAEIEAAVKTVIGPMIDEAVKKALANK